MHKFLRAAGFRGCKTRREEEELLSVLMNHKIETGRLELPEGTTYVEYHSELAPGIGVRMAGEETAEGEFHLDYYFPYLNGDFASSKEECTIERHAEKETYAGMLDEYKVGISLIF